MIGEGNYMIVLSPEQLEERISSAVNIGVEKALENLKSNKSEVEEPITEQFACKWIKVSRTSLCTWRREGKIPFQVLGGRIYYLRSELLAAMTKINSDG